MRKVIIGLIIAAIIIATIFVVYNVDFNKWFARRTGDIRQEYIIQDANKRIEGYEWFYAQYNEIEATRIKADIAKGMFEENGIKQVLASMIAEYNAKANSVLTVGQWRASDLPNHIDF